MPRRLISWSTTARSWVAPLAPRLLAAVWATWAAATGYAYRDGAPVQLATVEDILPVPLTVVWYAAAVALLAGALVPPQAGHRWTRLGSHLRGAGLVAVVALLGIWAAEFYTTGVERGWVTGKNYVLLALAGLTHAWWIGRDRAPRRQRGDPEVTADDS